MSNVETFIRQIQSRSREHQRAMELLAGEHLAGQMVAILRQELDSMVRVIYLLTQGQEYRSLLIAASVCGQKWTKEDLNGRVTDKQMIEAAQRLHGWTQSVYKFGCAFIHLSNLHDYNDRDPFLQLAPIERSDILQHCRHYHGGPGADAENFEGLLPFLPRILSKISQNLEGYLEQLQRGGQPRHYEI
jgi:hypothetical protein